MEIKINNRSIVLNDKDVEIAFKLVNSFLSSVKDSALSHGKLPMYLTTLVAMYVTGASMLKVLDPELTAIIAMMQEGREDD